MSDPFLMALGIRSSADGLRNALLAAVRRNRIYEPRTSGTDRDRFRRSWAALLVEAASPYKTPVTDSDHCRVISTLADSLSTRFACILSGGRLRFGTSQKAFNLYLKFLWRLGELPTPPHCPMDRVVLSKVGHRASWTRSDSEVEYMEWVSACRKLAAGPPLADWEYSLWNATAQARYPSLAGLPQNHAGHQAVRFADSVPQPPRNSETLPPRRAQEPTPLTMEGALDFEHFVEWMRRTLAGSREIPTMGNRSTFVATWDDARQILHLSVGPGRRTSGRLDRAAVKAIFDRWAEATAEKWVNSYYNDPKWPETPSRIFAPCVPAVIREWLNAR